MKEEEAQRVLRDLIESAANRQELLDPILICGKRSILSIVPRIEGVRTRLIVAAPDLRYGDVAATLTHLKENNILFIEQLDRLPLAVAKDFPQIMTTFNLPIKVGKEPNSKMVNLRLPPFTVIAATSAPYKLSAQLRSSFKREIHIED